MTGIFARKAWLRKGWADHVRFDIRDGRIAGLERGATPGASDVDVGIVVPGLCNAHSHAFQRALAGRTEERPPTGRDDFWTWRERMYALAGRFDAGLLAAVAAQAYVEMLECGYTSVVEFHYLHHPRAQERDAAMFDAIRSAANQSGIRLTYIPVLYERAGFKKSAPADNQQPFVIDVEQFLEHHAHAVHCRTERINIGIGAHSLRAVCQESLQQIAGVAARANVPMHLHIAEQQDEVQQCMAATGSRPVRWLLDNHAVDERWCLIHATHMDADECKALAGTGAVVCVCPSTEANLGDGLFALHDFLAAEGRIAIGSDSQVSINPFEELRWLEYGQRLAARSRNIAAVGDSHAGQALFARALAGGALAGGHVPAGLHVGAPADLVVLDADDPMLVAQDDATLLDALVFSGYRLPIERVMVQGDWHVLDAGHVAREETRAEFAVALDRLWKSP